MIEHLVGWVLLGASALVLFWMLGGSIDLIIADSMFRASYAIGILLVIIGFGLNISGKSPALGMMLVLAGVGLAAVVTVQSKDCIECA
jgi:hypothetical protein